MSPLNKRLPRDLIHNLGKYLGIFLLFLFAIAMGAGYLSAAHSIEVIQNDMHERYNVEDFHFATQFEAAKSSIEAVEAMGCTIYEDFTGTLKGTEIKVWGRVHAVSVNKTLVIVRIMAPNEYSRTYKDSVYSKIRHTIQFTK